MFEIKNGSIYNPTIIKSDGEKKFIIEGVMSKEIPDLENDIISAQAYEKAAEVVKARAQQNNHIPVFIEHRRKETLPVGRVLDAWKDGNELKFKAEIAKGTLGDPVRELIEQGYLKHCSIGGDALKSHKRYDANLGKEARIIDDFSLRELSLTSLPVNESAMFALTKSLNKESTKEFEETMAKLDKAIDAISSEKKIDEQIDLLKAIDPSTLDDAGLQKIKDSLDNLSKLLGIDTSGTGIVEDSATTVDVQSQPNLEQTGPSVDEELDEFESEQNPPRDPRAPAAPGSDLPDHGPNITEQVGAERTQAPQKPAETTATEEPVTGSTNLEAKLNEVNEKLDKLLGEKTAGTESPEAEEMTDIGEEDDFEIDDDTKDTEVVEDTEKVDTTDDTKGTTGIAGTTEEKPEKKIKIKKEIKKSILPIEKSVIKKIQIIQIKKL